MYYKGVQGKSDDLLFVADFSGPLVECLSVRYGQYHTNTDINSHENGGGLIGGCYNYHVFILNQPTFISAIAEDPPFCTVKLIDPYFRCGVQIADIMVVLLAKLFFYTTTRLCFVFA